MIVLALCAGCSAPPRSPAGPPELFGSAHDAAVNFTLPLLRGGSLILASLRGSPVVLSLFSTWDLRCQAEASFFNQLKERHGPRGLEVLGVALAPPGNQSPTLIKTYVEVTGMRHPVLLADPQNLELVGALGLTRRVPRTVLLDRQGRVVMDMVGQTDFPALRARIERMLRDREKKGGIVGGRR